MKCSEFTLDLTDLAFGIDAPEASAHVGVCPKCSKTVSELQRIASVFAYGVHDAPADVVQRAKAIGLSGHSAARMTRSTLAASGARRASADSFQRLFESGDVTVRVMYSRTGDAWTVVGRATPAPNLVRVGERGIEAGNGDFEFEAKDLEGTGFELVYSPAALSIPSGAEDLENELA